MSVVYFNVSESAVYAGVTRATVYRWIREGTRVRGEFRYLIAHIIGGQYRIEQPALNDFLDFRRKDSPSSARR